jgi:hypothetical protein
VDLTPILEKLSQLRMASIDTTTTSPLSCAYRPSPPVQIALVRAFEQRIGGPLPTEYVDFITKIGNGGAYGACNLLALQDAIKNLIYEPFSFDPSTLLVGTDELNLSGTDGFNFSEEASFRGCIGLEDFGCGSFAVLVILGEEAGRVWEYWGAADSLWHTFGENFLTWFERRLNFELNNYQL